MNNWQIHDDGVDGPMDTLDPSVDGRIQHNLLSYQTSQNFRRAQGRSSRRPMRVVLQGLFGLGVGVGLLLILQVGGMLWMGFDGSKEELVDPFSTERNGAQPLAMKGGDPYIRALMRTISVSESNVAQPYHVLYGGRHINDLNQHPDLCVPILVGPNVGQCTTAAGRYQFITTTWYEQAKRYHPRPSGLLLWETYSFEPQYQDAVVHDWLTDSQVWGVDVAERLRQGDIESVLQILSGTWTSLGYGIETNSMSSALPRIYHLILEEELGTANGEKPTPIHLSSV